MTQMHVIIMCIVLTFQNSLKVIVHYDGDIWK